MASPPPTVLVTGAAGLIGAAVCDGFARDGWRVHGLDNNQRRAFFGAGGDTEPMRRHLECHLPGYTHHHLDVRDRGAVPELFATLRPTAVVHAAAQPSHDLAARIPFDDFDVNAGGTLNLLEAARHHCPESPFVFLSTNKVYGDGPNRIRLREQQTRWDFEDPRYREGIGADFPVDRCLHSLFGASKLAADVMVQEYGRYFGMPTCCLRGGCLTGAGHAGVALHGFLNYLARCNLEGCRYTVFGYRGKQVRDNLDARDVADLIRLIVAAPRPAAVYNIGGGRANACSVLEAIRMVEEITGRPQSWRYEESARIGDHICYYTDLRPLRRDYPQWRVRRPLARIIEEIVDGLRRMSDGGTGCAS